MTANNERHNAAESSFRRVVAAVALANLLYFFIEFFVARHIGSVSLFADSVDFLEDTALNVLILLALRRSEQTRARVGMVLAALILVPTAAVLWEAWHKLLRSEAPEAWLLSATGLGALVVNFACAAALAGFRHHKGSLTRAAFLSARNDVFANLAIIAAALITLRWFSGWPDLLVGLAISAMNADAALKVWKSARNEHAAAVAH